jgi:hypothetical protein
VPSGCGSLQPLYVFTAFLFLACDILIRDFNGVLEAGDSKSPGKIELNYGMTGAVMLLFRLHF